MLMLHRAFSLAGTAVKASGTDAQPDAAGSVLWGLGSFPNKQKIAFVSRKPCLQKSEKRFDVLFNPAYKIDVLQLFIVANSQAFGEILNTPAVRHRAGIPLA